MESDEEVLYEVFCEMAEAHNKVSGTTYGIRSGSQYLTAPTTEELWKKYKTKVVKGG